MPVFYFSFDSQLLFFCKGAEWRSPRRMKVEAALEAVANRAKCWKQAHYGCRSQNVCSFSSVGSKGTVSIEEEEMVADCDRTESEAASRKRHVCE